MVIYKHGYDKTDNNMDELTIIQLSCGKQFLFFKY